MTSRLRLHFPFSDRAGRSRRAGPPRLGRLEAKALAVLVGVALCVGLGTSYEAEEATWKRLAAMPRERREALLARLEQFDALPSADQAAIRALDAKIQAEPEVNRAILYATLHRYHAWFRELNDAQKTELLAADPQSRMGLATKLFTEETNARTREIPFFLIADFGSASPFDQARQIKIWFKIDESRREGVLKAAEPQRLKRLESLGNLASVTPITSPTRQNLDANYKSAARSRIGPFLKRFDDMKSVERKSRLADHYYFIEHPPEKVKPSKLLEFDTALPPWIRSTIDRLPPDEAKRRLTILYRLVFPAPEEMPAPKPKAAATPAPARPAAKPATKPATKAATDSKNPF